MFTVGKLVVDMVKHGFTSIIVVGTLLVGSFCITVGQLLLDAEHILLRPGLFGRIKVDFISRILILRLLAFFEINRFIDLDIV